MGIHEGDTFGQGREEIFDRLYSTQKPPCEHHTHTKKGYKKTIIVPYKHTIDKIDQSDPEYLQEHRAWVKDKTNFEFEDTFTNLIEAREDRKVVTTLFPGEFKKKQ